MNRTLDVAGPEHRRLTKSIDWAPFLAWLDTTPPPLGPGPGPGTGFRTYRVELLGPTRLRCHHFVDTAAGTLEAIDGGLELARSTTDVDLTDPVPDWLLAYFTP